MELSITANIDLSVFQKLEELQGKMTSRLARVVQEVGDQFIAEWSKEAGIALKNPSGYQHHVQEGKIYPFDGDDLHFVIINNHPAVIYLEEGTAAFDMKRMLDTSAKVKIGKNGKRYIRIKFDHSVDSMKKAGIDPRELAEMSTSSKLPREKPTDPRRYQWGDRLTDMGDVGKKRKYFSVLKATPERFPGRGEKPTIDYTWSKSPFENLVKFKTNKGSQFMTFRTISDASDANSWIHPGIRASHIAESAFRTIDPIFKAAVQEVIPEIAREAFQTLGMTV